MSEEPTPTPSLKLKPRVRPPEGAPTSASEAGATPATQPASPSAPAIASASDGAAKVRLKPRLSVDAVPAESSAAPTEPVETSPAAAAPVQEKRDVVVPPLFRTDPEPAPAVVPAPVVARPAPPPAVILPPPAVIIDAPQPAGGAAAAPSAGEPIKFKLKPKAPPTEPPPAVVLGVPPPAPAPEASSPPPLPTLPPPVPVAAVPPPPPVAPPPVPGAPKPPSFPVMAPPVPKPAPAVPHVEVKSEIAPQVPETPAAAVPTKSRRPVLLALIAGVLVIAVAGTMWVRRVFFSEPLPPPPKAPVVAKPQPAAPAKTAPSPTPATPKAGAVATEAKPAVTTAPTAVAPTKASEPAPATAQPGLAHVPINAINKANAAAAAQGTGAAQTNEIVASDAPAASPAPVPSKPAAKPAAATSSAVTELAPGVSTTSQVDAVPEANAAFRTFVANARVGGVVGGSSPRALINGRLFRSGEVVDPALGISFEGVSNNRLVFKDKSGAMVSRRY